MGSPTEDFLPYCARDFASAQVSWYVSVVSLISSMTDNVAGVGRCLEAQELELCMN